MAGRRDNGEGTQPKLRKDGRWHIVRRYVDPITGEHVRADLYSRTKSGVVAKREELNARLRGGSSGSDSSMTVRDWCKGWIAVSVAASPRRESTQLNYERLLRCHVYDTTLGATPLSKIRPSSIEGWLLELRSRENRRTETTHRAVYRILKMAFDTAVRDGLIARNPTALVTSPKVSTVERVVPTFEELTALLSQTAGTILHNAWLFICATGIRKGECLALQWSDVDFEKGVVTIRRTVTEVAGGYGVNDPKTSASKRVLHPGATTMDVLRQQRRQVAEMRLAAGEEWRDGEWVFPTSVGTRHHPRNALRAYKNAASKAGISRNINIHEVRHFSATTMLIAGVDIKTVSKILGHADTRVTSDIYAHMTDDSRDRAMQMLGELTNRLSEATGTNGPVAPRPDDDGPDGGVASVVPLR